MRHGIGHSPIPYGGLGVVVRTTVCDTVRMISNIIVHPSLERLKMNIKDMVNNNQTVSFQFYRDGNLWYKTENEFSFPVPISDVGNATFMATDRAMLFMRYIRKHLQTIEQKDNSF